MFSYDSWTPQPRPDGFKTPCGRFGIERTGAEAWLVYDDSGSKTIFHGPFPTEQAAIAEAKRLAEANPIKSAKRTSASARWRS